VKLKVYLDTSVFSALFDTRNPVRQRETEAVFERLGAFEASTSEVGREELMRTPDASRREELVALVGGVQLIRLTDEMRELADQYVELGAFTSGMYDDALHVAAAVLSGQDVLLSWNFRHLVNRHRRTLVAEVNTVLGLPLIEIIAPPEL
jgi:predicted nucleic acid-binding protein